MRHRDTVANCRLDDEVTTGQTPGPQVALFYGNQKMKEKTLKKKKGKN